MSMLSLQRRYGFTLLAVGIAWGATLLLRVVEPNRPFSLVFFFAAVTLSAGVGGLGPGVLATLLSALLYDYFFLLPYHSLTVARSDVPLLVLFLLVAVLISGLSERLRAAKRAADQRFHDLVQNLEAIVWEGNPRTLQCTFVNHRAETLLGYPVQQWLEEGDLHQRILHPDDQEAVLDQYQRALEITGEQDLEYRVLAADGREIWLRETIHLIRDAGGNPIRMTGLCVDITERKNAARELSRQLVRVQEAERREIARELHDEVGQALTGLKLSLETALRLPGETTGQNLREAIALVNELVAHVGDLSLDLRPAMLDDFGLLPTLLWHFQRYTALTGVQVQFAQSGLERRFPQELETTAYRIVQEALTNVARHAEVNEVTVRLWATHGTLGIQVQDHGRGLDPAQIPSRAGGGGLAGMRERILLVEGRLTVETSPGNGVCLTAEFPWNEGESETPRRLP